MSRSKTPSGDLLVEKVRELFIIRRQIRRLQAREEKLVKRIGRRREYEGLVKVYPFRGKKKILLKIEAVEPRLIDPADLLRVTKRQRGFSMLKDFLNMVTVSGKKVRKRFGGAFFQRLSYTRCRYTRITVEEVEGR